MTDDNTILRPGLPAVAFREPARILSAGCLLAGMLVPLKVVMVGELYVGEIALLAIAVMTLLLCGVGPHFKPRVFGTFAAAGMLMLLGYVIADLMAVTAPAQYLRGWARTAMFVLDALALMLLVSRGEKLLWWFALGLAAGTLANMLIAGAAFTVTNWKEGYAFSLGMLVVLLAGRMRPLMACLAIIAFGVLSLLLDFRSLGGVFLLGGGIVLAGSARRVRSAFGILGWLLPVVALLAAAAATATLLERSDSDYRGRRIESDIGRYAGIVVAVEAIRDSPIFGYGSWAADTRYVQMLRREFEKAGAGKNIRGRIGESMLPHSQILQVWVEGGMLAALFFVLLGIGLILTIPWLALSHRYRSMTPLYVVLVFNSLWHLCFSPFLGSHRIMVACALAAISLLAWERSATLKAAALRRAGARPIPAG